MTEFQFILTTILLVFFIIFIVNRIITKRNKQKQVIPKGEKFTGTLNNLEKIIDGVSKKNNEKPIIDEIDDDAPNYSDYEKRINKKSPPKKNTYNSRNKTRPKSKKINIKDAIIGSEIINKRKK